jgi:hypothetical protein
MVVQFDVTRGTITDLGCSMGRISERKVVLVRDADVVAMKNLGPADAISVAE